MVILWAVSLVLDSVTAGVSLLKRNSNSYVFMHNIQVNLYTLTHTSVYTCVYMHTSLLVCEDIHTCECVYIYITCICLLVNIHMCD